MKILKFIKKIAIFLGVESQWKFYLIKFKELKLKLFLRTTKDEERYIKRIIKEKLGYNINLDKEPKTFNEKIQFRKLYDNNPSYSICADKYRVREYVKDKIGEEYLIPLLLVTDKLTEEQWDKLPNQFVAKANHNSGPVQIVKDKSKANKKEIIRELNNQLKLDYGVLSLEKYYSDIPRKIIVEEFLENDKKEIPEDYKFHCFNKSQKYILQLDRGRYIEHTQDFYDLEGNSLDILAYARNSKKEFEDPINYKKMIEIVKKLSKDFNYVRVDLYNLSGKIYFGELTFCPWSGFQKFNPEEVDEKWGRYWK